jgi:soluble lytic murein transglycosylase-like protein
MAFLDFKDLIADVAGANGYDPALLAAQANAESGFNPTATSGTGARGLVQFMPQTWAWAITMGWVPAGAIITDPRLNLQAATRFMRWLLDRFKATASPLELTLAAYNCGPGTVDKAIKATNRSDWDGIKSHLPQETQDYVPRITGRIALYRTVYGAVKAALPGLAVLLFCVVVLLRRFA